MTKKYARITSFKKSLYYVFAMIFMACTLVNCAKRGSPTGGPKDSIAPIFIKATPPNYSTNFEGDEIRIYFDEYIKLKDYQKQLIISPPLKNSLISPQGSASKDIKITLYDTLVPNTTYVFNFGQSIVDNNESNPFSSFKYVISTGDYIDSLSIKGTIIDELSSKPDNFVSVMLYAIDSVFTDSIVYKDIPRYVTNTLDSLTTFEIGNLKEGTYMLAAMKDEDANFTFQPNKDKIAFLEEYITIPTDSSYILKLFKENPIIKSSRPKHKAKGHVSFGVTGNPDSLDVKLLTAVPQEFKYAITRKGEEDTLHYWFKPKPEIDSLVFQTKGKNYLDTLVLRLRNPKEDSLAFNSITGRTLLLDKPFEVGSNIPITAKNDELMKVFQDSTEISFATSIDARNPKVSFDFKKEETKIYTIQLLPGALTDFFGKANDTLSFKTQTKETSDYGEIELTLDNAKNYPYIIQLLKAPNKVVATQYATQETVFTFNLLEAGEYNIRLIEDANGNQQYDTGNYLKKQQPEKVINYPKPIEVRASWYANETFTLKD